MGKYAGARVVPFARDLTTDAMDIKPPYGYSEIVPLDKSARIELPEPGALPPVFHSMHIIPLSYAEIAIASRDYPIAFVSGDGGATFLPMAILGLEEKQNLFVGESGAWDPTTYVPAYVRRYPFCMARVTVDGKQQEERVACVETSALNPQGEALFSEKGEPLPAWEARQKLLFEFEADLARTDQMCSTLKELALLEPFTMEAVPRVGAPLAMTGMHRVAEQKLAQLPGARLQALVQNGVLARIYSHLVSQLNFQRLLDRRARRPASAPAGTPLQ